MFKYIIKLFFSTFFLKICCDVYFGQRSGPLFIERWKLFIEIESLFNYYNGRKIIHELIYSDQRPKKIWVVWTWFDVIYQWFEIQTFCQNIDNHFLQAKIVNFDIIHHECWADKLQNPKFFYERIEKKHFRNYEPDVKTAAVASAIRSERQDVNVERVIMEDCCASNDFFIKKQKKILKGKKQLKIPSL